MKNSLVVVVVTACGLLATAASAGEAVDRCVLRGILSISTCREVYGQGAAYQPHRNASRQRDVGRLHAWRPGGHRRALRNYWGESFKFQKHRCAVGSQLVTDTYPCRRNRWR